MNFNYFKSKIQSKFIKNVTVLASGTAVAQLCSFLFIPILSRMYTQEAFGILASYTAIVALISSYATLKYDTALILPKSDFDAYALLKLSNIVSVILIILSVVVLFLPISYFQEYKSMRVLIGVGAVLSVNFNNSALWNIRFKQFKITSFAKIIQVVFIFFFQLLFFAFFEFKGLVLGNLLGILVSGCYLIFTRKLDWNIYKDVGIRDLKKVALRYIDFPKYFTFSNIISSVNSNLPVFYFTKFMSLLQLGFYGMAIKIITQPVSLIAESFKSVILAHMTEKKNEGDKILKWYLKIVLVLFLISVLGSVVVFFCGDFIVKLFLGDKWINVGRYIKLLIPMLIGLMIATPATAAVRVFEMQKYSLLYSIGTLVLNLLCFFIFYFLKSQFSDIIFYSSIISLSLVVINHLFIVKKIITYEGN